MENQNNPAAIFVADTHFHLIPDQTEQHQLDRFLLLLAAARQVDHLIMLGDIFDFWFDYPHFCLKGYETIFHALDQVSDAGTTIHFIGGNHDIWAAKYMHERYQCTPNGGPITLQLGQLRLHLVHGDGLLSHDWSYNSFRTLARNPLGIILAKSLHPELLYTFCKWLSKRSRTATREAGQQIIAKADRYLQTQTSADWDLMVIGHTHHPFVVEHPNRKLIGLGAWLSSESYGVLIDGQFHLRDLNQEPPFPV